jgi:hypothetical protein
MTASLVDPTREKLLGLLAAGVSQTSAALAVGVSDGYVSQLLLDSDFSQQLVAKRGASLSAAVAHDASIETVEGKALRAVEGKLPFVRNALEAARIFQILNSSKRRLDIGESGGDSLGAQQVTIVLPRAAAVQITMNASNQVIEVQGRSMATLPSRALPNLATDVAAKKKITDEDVASKLLASMAAVSTVINGVERVL